MALRHQRLVRLFSPPLSCLRRGRAGPRASDQRVDKAAYGTGAFHRAGQHAAPSPSGHPPQRHPFGARRHGGGGHGVLRRPPRARAGAGRPEAVFVTFAIWVALARYASGRLFERIHPRVFVMPSLAVLGAGLAPWRSAGILSPSSSRARWWAWLRRLPYSPSRLHDRPDHDAERWGVTTWFTTAYELGVTLGPIVIGLVAALYSVTGGFVTLALLSGIGSVRAAWLDRGRPTSVSQP